MRKIEICCGSVEDVVAARVGGASRIELCSALDLGGVTPSAGLIVGAIREKGEMSVNVLIRPRQGDFIYTPYEVSVMEADIAAAREAGADGVVIGALLSDGGLDLATVSRLIKAAEGMDMTFHRAFDECADPFAALEQLVDLGIPRLLTSGLAASAQEGLPLIAKLVRQAAGRVSIMPGAGINPANIREIATESGATEFHSTASDKEALLRESRLFGPLPRATKTETVRALVEGIR